MVETFTSLPQRHYFCWNQQPPKARAQTKPSEGFEAGNQYLCWFLVPPEVEKPKGDAKGKAAPKDDAVKNAGKAKGVAKEKAPAGASVAPVLFPRQEVVKEVQHLQWCHHGTAARLSVACISWWLYIQSAFHMCLGTLLRWRRVLFLDLWPMCLFRHRLPAMMIFVGVTDVLISMICSTWLSTPLNSLSF